MNLDRYDWTSSVEKNYEFRWITCLTPLLTNESIFILIESIKSQLIIVE